MHACEFLTSCNYAEPTASADWHLPHPHLQALGGQEIVHSTITSADTHSLPCFQ